MAVAVLTGTTASNRIPDAVSDTVAHTVAAGTSTLLVAVLTRSFDATNPPANWTVTYGGTAVTEGINTFDDTPFAGGRVCVWVGYLHSPTAGAANLIVASNTTHRGCLIVAMNLSGTSTAGTPFGAAVTQRSAASTTTSVSLSTAAQSVTADNMFLSLLMIAQNTPLTSFDGTGYTTVFAGQISNFPNGGCRYKLGAIGTVSTGSTWSGSTTNNIGGALIEVMAAASAVDDSISDDVSADVSGSFAAGSTAKRTDVGFWDGMSRWSYLQVFQAASAAEDGVFVRIGTATTAYLSVRGRIDNGQGSTNVYRFFADLTDGNLFVDTESGTQTTNPAVLGVVQAPGNGGKVFFQGIRQAGAYREGEEFTGSLDLSGIMEIGGNAAASPPAAAAVIARILIDSQEWSDAKMEFVSKAILERRRVYSFGGEETAAEIAANAPRSVVALPMQPVLGAAPSIDLLLNVTDPDSVGWSVTSISQPSQGTVQTISAQAVRYTPTPGYTGLDNFTYTVTGGNGKASTGRIDANVSRPSLQARDNGATVANTQSNIRLDVLGNDSYTPPVSITGVTNPPHGTATIDNASSPPAILYTPDTGYIGADSFTYTIADQFQNSSATVSITVTGTATEFVDAQNDIHPTALTPGTQATIQVLTNDQSSSALEVSAHTQGAKGVVAIPATPSRILYTPNSGTSGSDTFQYTARLVSNPSITDSATVTVSIGATATTPAWGPGPKSDFPDYWIGGRAGSWAQFSNTDIAGANGIGRAGFPDVVDLWNAYQDMPDAEAAGFAWIAGADSPAQETTFSHYGGVMTSGQWSQAWAASNQARACKLNIALCPQSLSTKNAANANRWELWFDFAAGIHNSHFFNLGRRMAARDDAASIQVGTADDHYPGGASGRTAGKPPNGMRILVWGWEINDSQNWSYFALPSTRVVHGNPIGTLTNTKVGDGLSRIITAFNNGYYAHGSKNCPYYHGTRPTLRCPGGKRLRDILWNWTDASLCKVVGQSLHHNDDGPACQPVAGSSPVRSNNAIWNSVHTTDGVNWRTEGLSDGIGELADKHGWKIWLDETGQHFAGPDSANAHPRADMFWMAIHNFLKANPSLCGGVSFYQGSSVNGICNTSLIANPNINESGPAEWWSETRTWWRNTY